VQEPFKSASGPEALQAFAARLYEMNKNGASQQPVVNVAVRARRKIVNVAVQTRRKKSA
jgi:hypothetical protein